MAWEHAFSQHMLDLALSEEDVEELRSERSIKHTTITSEDIEALSVDENLSPLDRLLYILDSGKDVQKVHAMQNMFDIVKSEPKDSMEKVLVLFKEVFFNSAKEVQIAGACFLVKACENKLLNGEKFAGYFSKELLNSIRDKETDIAEEWIIVIIRSFDLPLPNRYMNEVIAFLKTSGSLTQPMNVRLLCCKLVAHVAKFMDERRRSAEIIPVMKSLCQDIEQDVRACMCTQLGVFAMYLTDSAVADVLLPELTLLLEDEEASVRLVALETLSQMSKDVTSTVMSRLSKETATFYQETVRRCVASEMIGSARYIGEFMTCPDFLADEDKSKVMEAYSDLCRQGVGDNPEKMDGNLEGAPVGASGMDSSAECRYWCSYNFPAVLVSASESRKGSLVSLFVALIRDSHATVRKAMACSFHEVAKLIIDNNLELVYDTFLSLLSEKDMDIVDGLQQGFEMILHLLSTKTNTQNNYVTSMLPTLLECEQCISRSLRWRVHEKFLGNIAHLTEFLTSEEIYQKLVPVLFSILSGNKVIPVRLAAGKTLLHFMRHSRNVDERTEICVRLNRELAHSRSTSSRILYLDLCYFAANLFSKSFFKEYFYSGAMELASDSVVNVKLKFCTSLPLLKSQIRLPCDRLLLQNLEQQVRKIMALENGRDISIAIRSAITDMDNVTIHYSSPHTEEDIADQRKEDEEEAIVEEFQQRKSDISGKLSKDRQRSNSLLHNHSRGSIASTDSMDKNLNRKPSKTPSLSKVPSIKKTNKYNKDGQSSSKVAGRTSNAKVTKR